MLPPPEHAGAIEALDNFGLRTYEEVTSALKECDALRDRVAELEAFLDAAQRQ